MSIRCRNVDRMTRHTAGETQSVVPPARLAVMEPAPEAGASAPPGDATAPAAGDVPAPAPAVRTFAVAPITGNWADEDDEEEPMTEERQRQFDALAEKYRSRADRFGTDADRAPAKRVRPPGCCLSDTRALAQRMHAYPTPVRRVS